MKNEIKKELDRIFCESFLKSVYNFASTETGKSGAESSASGGEMVSTDPKSSVTLNDESKKLVTQEQDDVWGTSGSMVWPDEKNATSDSSGNSQTVKASRKGVKFNKYGRVVIPQPEPVVNTVYPGSITFESVQQGDGLTPAADGKSKNPTEKPTKSPANVEQNQTDWDAVAARVAEFNEKLEKTKAEYEKTDKGEEATKVYKAKESELKKTYADPLAKNEARNTVGNMLYRMAPGSGETWTQAWNRLTPEQKWSIGIGGGVSSLLGLSMLTKKKKDLSDYIMAGLFPVAGVAAGAFGGAAINANPNTFNVDAYNRAYQRYNPTSTNQTAA